MCPQSTVEGLISEIHGLLPQCLTVKCSMTYLPCLCCYYQHYRCHSGYERGLLPDRRAHSLRSKGARAASADQGCVAVTLVLSEVNKLSRKGTKSKYFRPGRSHAVSVHIFFFKQFFKNVKTVLAHRLTQRVWLARPCHAPSGGSTGKKESTGRCRHRIFSPHPKSRWKLRV